MRLVFGSTLLQEVAASFGTECALQETKEWRKRNWHSPGGWTPALMSARHAITRTRIKQNSIAWIAMVLSALYA
ncbi:MAG: hypothetical protein ABI923_12575 [bacterium]